ncbi:MAG: 3-methyl-2-oxobutanoate hydroxymethyltransferase [Candidatus Liptonbacteria bacterium GWB1_49_6]|uniref:3-methyl-2-oxobutanoate hydroxymethyltransferase n=1 Tax=Candidatus Liptonbacteria bacterium GWB1_49_6 TaxID=1798644 RepID=A0A1G2C6R1_9BACT|nr:MAG: 3-methyl-2-oxobutanoate hydroxymethyltransferase [Candidatus Liptonbacteria bacterium GWB1_49_6]
MPDIVQPSLTPQGVSPLVAEVKRRPDVKVTTLQSMKEKGIPVAALSIYDYPFARTAAKAGVDVIIVGDSLGMTVLGYGNTLPVTMDEMIVFASAAARGASPMFTVGDMPLGAYQISNEEAVRNAIRFIKEAKCAAVKCEASMKLLPRFEAIANAEVLVMGHLGLNPQKIHEMGGHRIQGKTIEGTKELLKTAKALESAGAFAILLEGVTEEVSGIIRNEIKIPVYGIGSGRFVDGQLLIGHDPLDLYDWGARPVPKYIKHYRSDSVGKTAGEVMLDAFSRYVQEVKARQFPFPENVHHIDIEAFKNPAKGSEEDAARILELMSFLPKAA